MLAVVLAVVTVPAHLVGLRGPWPAAEPAATVHADPGAIARSRPFLMLVVAVGLGVFTCVAVVVNQVPLLIERGLSTSTAAWALGLGGVGQVLGRLGYGRLVRHVGVRARAVAVLSAIAVTTLLLALIPGPAALLVVASMLAGSARGIFTLLQATAVTDRWGATHYGRLGGLLATAVSPWAGAALADVLGGYPAVFLGLAGTAVLAAASAGAGTPRLSASVRSSPGDSAGRRPWRARTRRATGTPWRSRR